MNFGTYRPCEIIDQVMDHDGHPFEPRLVVLYVVRLRIVQTSFEEEGSCLRVVCMLPGDYETHLTFRGPAALLLSKNLEGKTDYAFLVDPTQKMDRSVVGIQVSDGVFEPTAPLGLL